RSGTAVWLRGCRARHARDQLRQRPQPAALGERLPTRPVPFHAAGANPRRDRLDPRRVRLIPLLELAPRRRQLPLRRPVGAFPLLLGRFRPARAGLPRRRRSRVAALRQGVSGALFIKRAPDTSTESPDWDRPYYFFLRALLFVGLELAALIGGEMERAIPLAHSLPKYRGEGRRRISATKGGPGESLSDYLMGTAGSGLMRCVAGSMMIPTDSKAVPPSNGSLSSGPKITRPEVSSPMNSISARPKSYSTVVPFASS